MKTMKMIAGWSLVSQLIAGAAPAAESPAVTLTSTVRNPKRYRGERLL